jgi:hypothetical protein
MVKESKSGGSSSVGLPWYCHGPLYHLEMHAENVSKG